MNVILVYLTDTLQVLTSNIFIDGLDIKHVKSDLENIDAVFPDKTKDMRGYSYRIGLRAQLPRIMLQKNRIISVDLEVFKEIAQKQNATLNVTFFYDDQDTEENLSKFLTAKNDLILNNVVPVYRRRAKSYHKINVINTWDDNGFCALIPIPERLSFLNFIYQIFDEFTWICLITSTFVCGVLWKLLSKNRKNSNSALYFMFVIISNFLGQMIPLRSSRRMQLILFQLCVLMTFIMGNAFQSLIISSMSQSRNGTRFKSFEEIFASDMIFRVDPMFQHLIESSDDLEKLSGRIEEISERMIYEKLAKEKRGIILMCDQIEYIYNEQSDSKAADYYYMLPDKYHKMFVTFPLTPMNPLLHEIQTNFDYIFESGIRQHWNFIFKRNKTTKINREYAFVENEEYLLNLTDVHGVLYILLAGIVSGGIILLTEIFWNGCIVRFKRKEIGICTNTQKRRGCKRKKTKAIVRQNAIRRKERIVSNQGS